MSETEVSRGGALREAWASQRVVIVADLASALLRRAGLVFGVPFLMGLAAFLFFQFRGSYLAVSSLTPEDAASSLSQFAGLAARFGGSVPGLGQSESMDFYASVLASPALLAEVVTTEFRFAKEPGGRDSLVGTLQDLYGVDEDTPSERLRLTVKRLQGRVSVSTDRLANVISISVKAPFPELAQRISRRMLDVLNEFNLQKRQTKARAQRVFAEERMGQARAELTAAEELLQRFLEANRTYQTSPRLVFEAARLQRRIEVRQQVYTTLVQAFEQARIDEVRDTPVFTVIQPPELFTRRSRSPMVMGILAMFFFGAISVAAALFLEYVEQERISHPESFARLRETVEPVWRRLRPRRGPKAEH